MSGLNNRKTLFQQVLGEFSQQDFFEKYWGKNWLWVPGVTQNESPKALSTEAIDQIFANNRLKYPWVKLVKQGQEIPFKQYVNHRIPGAQVVDNQKLFQHLDQGATIIANSIDKSDPTIGSYCRQLEKELGVKVWANIYISPAGSRGFGIHQDVHDVIVVQLSGTKNWHIYPPEENYDGPRQPGPNDIAEKEFEVQSGDIIYLPKNYPHMAFAGDQPSLHITLGFEGLFWIDIVEQLLTIAKKDPAFAQRVPIGFEGKDRNLQFQKVFTEKWESLLMENSAEKLIAEAQKTTVHFQNEVQSSSYLSNWINRHQVTETSTLRKNENLAIRVTSDKRMITIFFGQQQLSFPVFINDLLKALLSETPYQLSTIQCSQSIEERVVMAKKLLEYGVLTYVES